METYAVLEFADDAKIELDGDLHPVKSMTSILPPRGVRHRAIKRPVPNDRLHTQP